MRPLLVGEDNPHSSDPADALLPTPGTAGGNLCRRIMGLTEEEYLLGFDRANLCAGRWDAKEAAERAKEIADDDSREAIVLLGAKVASAFRAAFGCRLEPFRFYGRPGSRRVYVYLPHPSGRSRSWNDPAAVSRAREALRQAGCLPVPPPTQEDWVASLPFASCTVNRPARCANCLGLVEGADCPDCGPP